MTTKPTITLNNMTPQQSAQFLDAIDWGRLIPLVVELIQLIQQGNLPANWQQALRLVMQIISIITDAQQLASVQFDWSQLIELFIRYLLPIIIGAQPNNQPTT